MGLSGSSRFASCSNAQAGEIAVSGSANVTMLWEKLLTQIDHLVQTKTLRSLVQVKWTTVGVYCKYSFNRCLFSIIFITSLTMGQWEHWLLVQIQVEYHCVDEEVPQVYEQTSDAQQTQRTSLVPHWTLQSRKLAPALELGGATVNIGVEYSPQAADAGANDGGQHTYSEVRGSGMGAGVTIAYDALKVGYTLLR